MRSESEILRDWAEFRRTHPLPQETRFDGKLWGHVIDEEFVAENAGDGGDYVKMVQRLKDMDGNPWVRFTYYRKRDLDSHWRLAGQTSLLLSLNDAKDLLERARAKWTL